MTGDRKPLFYLPPISVLTAAAAAGFVVCGVVFAVGLGVATHWLAGLLVGAVFCGIAYVAAEQHAATQRVPDGSGLTAQGAGFRAPEDQDDEPERVRGVDYDAAGEGSTWREP